MAKVECVLMRTFHALLDGINPNATGWMFCGRHTPNMRSKLINILTQCYDDMVNGNQPTSSRRSGAIEFYIKKLPEAQVREYEARQKLGEPLPEVT